MLYYHQEKQTQEIQKKVKHKFPENFYTEVRIEDNYSANYYLKDDDAEGNGEVSVIGAKIRVFDGKMWYTSTTKCER